MDRAELLTCMWEAAEALAEFRRFLPVHCPEAMHHLEEALLHFDVARALCRNCWEADRGEDDPHGGGGGGGGDDDHHDDDDDADLPPRLRFHR